MSTRAILFPGQGAQFVGMAADLLDRSPGAKEMFEAASDLLGEDLYRICAEGPPEALDSTAISQPAIFTVSLAVVSAIESASSEDVLESFATAGLSLGEYSALVFAGAVRFEDALEVVIERGRLMQEACDRVRGGMTTILGLVLSEVEELVAIISEVGVISVANVNSETQIVVSGEEKALERAAEMAISMGAGRVIPLRVAGAYHSPLMATATTQLKPTLEKLEIVEPGIGFIPNVLAEWVSDPEHIRKCLIRQMESPVLWQPTLRVLKEKGLESVVEPGPGRVIAGLVKQVDREISVQSVLDAQSTEALVGEGQS